MSKENVTETPIGSKKGLTGLQEELELQRYKHKRNKRIALLGGIMLVIGVLVGGYLLSKDKYPGDEYYLLGDKTRYTSTDLTKIHEDYIAGTSMEGENGLYTALYFDIMLNRIKQSGMEDEEYVKEIKTIYEGDEKSYKNELVGIATVEYLDTKITVTDDMVLKNRDSEAKNYVGVHYVPNYTNYELLSKEEQLKQNEEIKSELKTYTGSDYFGMLNRVGNFDPSKGVLSVVVWNKYEDYLGYYGRTKGGEYKEGDILESTEGGYYDMMYINTIEPIDDDQLRGYMKKEIQERNYPTLLSLISELEKDKEVVIGTALRKKLEESRK